MSGWYTLNKKMINITKNLYWWTMSPTDASSTNYVYFVRNYVIYNEEKSYLNSTYGVQYYYAVRPVLSLSSCVTIKSGNGTPESPYEIDYDGSCN